MAGRYSVDGQDTNTAGTNILGITGSENVRPRVYDLICGSDDTPADNAAEYVLQRSSAAGSGDTVTPQPLDFDDPAAETTALEAHTTDATPVANAIMLQWAQNQRATFRWVAAPGGEIMVPATDNAGLFVEAVNIAGSAVNTNVCMHFEE